MKITISEQCLLQQVGSESVILDLPSGQYFEINETGTAIIQALKETQDTEITLERVFSQYRVPKEQLREDIHTLTQKLIDANLATVQNP